MSQLRPFESVVFQLFLDLLRASGHAMNQNQIETLRASSFRFAEIFKAEAKVACLEYLKEFQENVKASMDELEAKISQVSVKKPKVSEAKDLTEMLNKVDNENSLDKGKKIADN